MKRAFSILLLTIAVVGCVTPPVAQHDDTADRLRELSEKIDRQPAPQSVDTSNLERELADLRNEVKAMRQPAQQAEKAEKPKRVKATGWTGCVVHLDGVQGRCPPCEDFKADMERYRSNPDHAWTFGRTNESHFRLQYHQTQDIPLPTFEFFENGSLIHTIEGYPRTYEIQGMFGPWNKLIESHPLADHESVKATYKAERNKSRERWGGYGTSSTGTVIYGAPFANSAGNTSFSMSTNYGSNGGSGGYSVYRMRSVVRPARVYSVPMYSAPMSYGVVANCYGGVCVP